MKIKVCGMRESENIKALVALKPDFMGFIFYPKSPRFTGEMLDQELLLNFPAEIKKTGVFVNAETGFILEQVRKYDFQYVQLHGHETPEISRILKDNGVGVIKAFSVDKAFGFSTLDQYKDTTDYFLFDTKGEGYGGHGVSFDWRILEKYELDTPFLLAGGISPDNIDHLDILKDKPLAGIDVNSKFEISPGLKNIELLKQLFEKIRTPHKG
ncbi:phosphoribosylanthranilate isomerase [Emticicia sp. CRIBPO]|uniref:phosphoribosylanthranilate isomerase n=1 Tax=Emticicia sp. CRIBPO TaxID=2683258 RepID=UPI001412F4E0|nr:phosphoribosylanthranilate isomerase [Emticicia sp. CRIBPO]NBA88047.1 phosphoribosylanthranilate isomerase [Emticicia sp. CRIBPO]